MAQRPLAAVVGVGVGIGGHVAVALAKAGFDVGLMARNKTYGADKLTGPARAVREVCWLTEIRLPHITGP
jgi:hypothetical protein